MNKKKLVVAVVVIAVLAIWFFVGFRSGGSSESKAQVTGPPPATAFEISQGNWLFYANAYKPQGSTVVMTDFYVAVDGKWKRQTTPTILSEKNGEIKIRRLQ